MPTTYSRSTLRRARTILRNQEQADTIARKAAARAPRKPAQPKAAPKADWRTRPASQAQVRRIQALEVALGYKPSTIAIIGNAGQASDLYQSLKAERNA